MKILLKIWTWLDGKKTVIGTVFLFISAIIEDIFVDMLSIEPNWLLVTAKVLSYTGILFGGVGLGHKGLKKK